MLKADQLLDAIVEAMESDNCCQFVTTEQDRQEAAPYLGRLVAAGYFANGGADDMDSDVWEAAAGEYSESKRHFRRDLPAFEGLSVVLNRIFDRPVGVEN